jgi:UDP-N-acetylmuramoylalanine--D-glutamate ligase
MIIADENAGASAEGFPPGASFFAGPEALPHLLDASRVILSPGVPGVHPFRRALSEAGIPLTSGTDLWMQGHRDQAIGVTGTKGKSTTSSLITAILNRCGLPTRTAGNIGTPLLGLPEYDGTTVVELSSYQCHSLTVSPRVSVIVNLYQEHLTWHGGLEEYWRDKCRIFTQGADVLVADCETLDVIVVLGVLVREGSGYRLGLGFCDSAQNDGDGGCGADSGCDPDDGCDGGNRRNDGGTLRVVTPTEETRTLVARAIASVPSESLPRLFASGPGAHNLTLAVCAAQAWGVEVSEDILVDVISTFESLPHRLAFVGHVGGLDWYDDTLSTAPESVIAALDSFPERAVVLIAGGQSRGVDYNNLGRFLTTLPAGRLPLVVTIPSNGPEVIASFADGSRVQHASSLSDAVRLIADRAPSGSVVLLSPGAPSYDLYANFEQKSAEYIRLVTELE